MHFFSNIPGAAFDGTLRAHPRAADMFATYSKKHNCFEHRPSHVSQQQQIQTLQRSFREMKNGIATFINTEKPIDALSHIKSEDCAEIIPEIQTFLTLINQRGIDHE